MEEINLNCGVYQIRNIVTNVCYSGQSIVLKKRPNEHWGLLRNNNHWNQYLQNSYNKHGKKSFVFEILLYCTPEELTYYEQLFCDINKSHGLSYNIRDCVDSNKGLKHTVESIELMKESARNISDETREKRSKSRLGKKHSPETIEKLSGKNHPNFGKRGKETSMWGKTPSLKTRNLMREAKIGKYDGENNPMFGKHHSEESRKAMSESKMGEKCVFFGKHHSKETRDKMSESAMGHIVSEKARNKIRKALSTKKEIVLKILQLLDEGMSVKEICETLDVGSTPVYNAKKGFYDDIYDL